MLAQGTERRSLELEIVLADGSALDVQIVGSGAPEKGDAAGTLHLALLDVTELRRTERALQAAAAAASLAEERERRKLAADLHDDAGQLLSLASLKLHALGDALGWSGAPRIGELEELLAEMRRRISSLSFQLSPPLLHDVGLIAAAQWLAEDLKSGATGSRFDDLEERGARSSTRTRASRSSGRFASCSLNVVKHAGVNEAHVRIWRDGGMARVCRRGRRCRLAPESQAPGLRTPGAARAGGAAGRSVEIESARRQRDTVVVSVPVASRDADAQGGSR